MYGFHNKADKLDAAIKSIAKNIKILTRSRSVYLL